MTRTRRRAIALVAALALLSLTGCQSRAGAAALVGSGRISEDQVRAVVQQGLAVGSINQAVAADAGGYRRLILGRLLKHAVIAGAARKLRVSAPEGPIDAAINANVVQLKGRPALLAALAGSPYELPPSQLRPFFRDIILLEVIGQRLAADRPVTDAEALKFYNDNGGQSSGQSFTQLRSQVVVAVRGERAKAYVRQYISSQKIVVSPRYGRFDPTKLFDRGDTPSVVATRDNLVRDS